MPHILPGMMWREIRLLHERGLSKIDALRAATSRAAALLGVDGQVGSVLPGKQADLILVRVRPDENLSDLRTVALVMQAGKVVHRTHEHPASTIWGMAQNRVS